MKLNFFVLFWLCLCEILNLSSIVDNMVGQSAFSY